MFLLCLIKFFIVRRERGGPLPLGVPPPTPPSPVWNIHNFLYFFINSLILFTDRIVDYSINLFNIYYNNFIIYYIL